MFRSLLDDLASQQSWNVGKDKKLRDVAKGLEGFNDAKRYGGQWVELYLGKVNLSIKESIFPSLLLIFLTHQYTTMWSCSLQLHSDQSPAICEMFFTFGRLWSVSFEHSSKAICLNSDSILEMMSSQIDRKKRHHNKVRSGCLTCRSVSQAMSIMELRRVQQKTRQMWWNEAFMPKVCAGCHSWSMTVLT